MPFGGFTTGTRPSIYFYFNLHYGPTPRQDLYQQVHQAVALVLSVPLRALVPHRGLLRLYLEAAVRLAVRLAAQQAGEAQGGP